MRRGRAVFGLSAIWAGLRALSAHNISRRCLHGFVVLKPFSVADRCGPIRMRGNCRQPIRKTSDAFAQRRTLRLRRL